LHKGFVYRSLIYLPDWETEGEMLVERRKYCIVLAEPSQNYTAVVVADSDKSDDPPRRTHRYEVSLGQDDGFPAWSVVDCRWVFTFPRGVFPPEDHSFSLGSGAMEKIAAALVVGLGFDQPMRR
jgi:hypothetical protein